MHRLTQDMKFVEDPLRVGMPVKIHEHKGQGLGMLGRDSVVLNTTESQEGHDQALAFHLANDNFYHVAPQGVSDQLCRLMNRDQ